MRLFRPWLSTKMSNIIDLVAIQLIVVTEGRVANTPNVQPGVSGSKLSSRQITRSYILALVLLKNIFPPEKKWLVSAGPSSDLPNHHRSGPKKIGIFGPWDRYEQRKVGRWNSRRFNEDSLCM